MNRGPRRIRRRSHIVHYRDISSSKRVIKKSVCSKARNTSLLTTAEKDRSRSSSPEIETSVAFHYSSDDEAEGRTTSSDHKKRQQKASDNWSEIRDQLLHAVVESSVPFSGALCRVCNNIAVAKCGDCGPLTFYCSDHVESMHSQVNIFHRPQIWSAVSQTQ